MELWGVVNDLVSLASASDAEQQDLFTQGVIDHTERLAFYELAILH